MYRKLWEAGFSVLATRAKSKAPVPEMMGFDEWAHTRQPESLIDTLEEKYPLSKGHCVAVICGPYSNISAIDLDTENPAVLDAVPVSPVIRKGKPGRAGAYFFQYISDGGNPKAEWKNERGEREGVEIINRGRYIIVPPSFHPETGEPYKWITPDSILDIKSKDLPVLSQAELNRLLDTASRVGTTQNHSKGEGRNNRMVALITAMRVRGEPESKIVQEAYEFDRTNHSPRLFTDPDEGYRARHEEDARYNTWKMVCSVSRSLVSKRVALLETPVSIQIDEDAPPTAPAWEEKPLPEPEPETPFWHLYKLILDFSERDMPHLALGGSISLLSAFACHRFAYNDIFPNTYVMNLAPTGAGKSFPYRVAKRLLNEEIQTNLLYSGGVQSVAALIKNLRSQPVRLLLNDEMSSDFIKMRDGSVFQSEIVEALCQLWSESNSLYLARSYAQREDDASCYNPCINILGSSTQEGFRSSLNTEMIFKGLLPRFVFFSHTGYGKIKNGVFAEDRLRLLLPFLSGIYDTKPRRERSNNVLYGDRTIPMNVAPKDYDTVRLEKDIKREFAEELEGINTPEMLKHFYTRGYENVMKLATLHCIGSARTQVTAQDLTWAVRLFKTQLHNVSLILESVTNGSQWDADLASVANVVKSLPHATTRDLCRRTRLSVDRIKKALEQLTASEHIERVEVKGKKRRMEAYRWRSDTPQVRA